MKIVLFLLAVATLPAFGEDIYVSQAGGGSGTSCSDTRSLAWLNDIANWGGGTTLVSPGDTVHLCGIFTSNLNVASNGVLASPVTFKFEAGAGFESPRFPVSSGAIKIISRSHITIDGNNVGFIRNTNNGTVLGLQLDSVGIYAKDSAASANTNITINSLSITGIYVKKALTAFLPYLVTPAWPGYTNVTSPATNALNPATINYWGGQGVALGVPFTNASGQIINAILVTNGVFLFEWQQVLLTGTLPTGLSTGQWYWVKTSFGQHLAQQTNVMASAMQLSLTYQGAAITFPSPTTAFNIAEARTLDANQLGNAITITANGITISNCILSDATTPLDFSASMVKQTNILVLTNRITEYNWGMSFGMADSNCYLTNFVLADNFFEAGTNWNLQNSSFHANGIHSFNNSYDLTSLMEGIYITRNTFGSNFGNFTTAAIFWDQYRPSKRIRFIFVWNNVFLEGSQIWGNGNILVTGSNNWVFNNTSWATASSVSGNRVGGDYSYFYNNILKNGSLNLEGGNHFADGMDAYHYSTNFAASYFTSNQLQTVTNFFRYTWSDHNIFGPSPAFGIALINSFNVNNFGSPLLPTWQSYYAVWSATHADPNSTTNLPTFNAGTYVPTSSDTVARAKGTNLTTILQATPGFRADMLTDFNGNPRPGGVAEWTIGAFEAAAVPISPSAVRLILSGGANTSSGATVQ